MNQTQVAQAKTTAIVPGDRLKARDPANYSLEDLKKAVNKRVRLNVAPGLLEAFMGKPSLQEAVDAYVADHVRRYGHDRDIILTKDEIEERTRQSNAASLVETFLRSFKGEDPKRQAAEEKVTYLAVRQQAAMRKITVRDPDSLTTVMGRYLNDKKILSVPVNQRDPNTYLDRTKVTPEVIQALKEKLLSYGL